MKRRLLFEPFFFSGVPIVLNANLEVRRANLADLNVLAELFDQHRRLQGKAVDLEACREFLLERFERAESIVMMAFHESHAIGFAQLYPSFSSTALSRVYILNDLFVAEQARRLGVASALLQSVEEFAWSNGACRVSLNVARGNINGQALYEARNWVRDQDFFAYHRFPG